KGHRHAQAEIARLTAALERTEANRNDILADLDGVTAERDAIAAAAFEAAAQEAGEDKLFAKGIDCCGDCIRILTPADAKAALDRMLREAKAEGMRMAEGILREMWASTSAEHSDAILARAKDMEAEPRAAAQEKGGG